MILYGASLKLFAIAAIIARIATPIATLDPRLDLLIFTSALIVLAIVVGAVESVIARLRLVQVPNLLVGACILSTFGIVLLVR
jgi:formate hydrogenlyase subunit 4